MELAYLISLGMFHILFTTFGTFVVQLFILFSPRSLRDQLFFLVGIQGISSTLCFGFLRIPASLRQSRASTTSSDSCKSCFHLYTTFKRVEHEDPSLSGYEGVIRMETENTFILNQAIAHT